MDDKTQELDKIEEQARAATTIEDYEAADAAFYAIDRDARRSWLADQASRL